jgi:hypothetical protein
MGNARASACQNVASIASEMNFLSPERTPKKDYSIVSGVMLRYSDCRQQQVRKYELVQQRTGWLAALCNWRIACSRIFLEKLIVAYCLEPCCSLPCSQQPSRPV